jgi:hypothetical protein
MSSVRDSIRSSSKAATRAALLLLASAATFAGGRPDDSTRNWFGDLSGGWAFPESDAGDILDDDWVLSGGATYWPSSRNVGINLNLGYAVFDLSDSAIQNINTLIAQDPSNGGRVDDGDVEMWQLGVNAIWSPGGSTESGVYLTGGITANYLKGTVTQTGLVYVPPFCDPWYWWWCFPGGFGRGAIPVASDSTTEYGYNIGVGYSFAAGDGRFFIETKYDFVKTDSEDLVFIPLTFGYRW